MDYQFYHTTRGHTRCQILVHWPTFRIVLALSGDELSIKEYRPIDVGAFQRLPRGSYSLTNGFADFSKYSGLHAEYVLQTENSTARFKSYEDAMSFISVNGGAITRAEFKI